MSISSSQPIFHPSVSVVVPIYNGEADLPELISCLKAQTYPKDKVNYLLVDNNSQDLTAQLLQTAAQEAASQGINLRHLKAAIQSSYAARNAAIKASYSDIIAFTDADCRPQSDWLEQLILPFVNSQVGIVAGEIMALPGSTLLEQYADRQDVLSQKHTLANKFCPYGQTANLAIRHSILAQVGLFRPHLTTGGDADICWRILRETDWKIEFASQAIVRHRHRATLKELRSQWRRYGRSNRYLNELHGIALQREFTQSEALYRLSRWLVKELPRNSMKMAFGKASLVDLISTPLDLITFQARSAGQKESKLNPLAKEIEQIFE